MDGVCLLEEGETREEVDGVCLRLCLLAVGDRLLLSQSSQLLQLMVDGVCPPPPLSRGQDGVPTCLR